MVRSPLSFFKRYQYIFLVAFTAMLMFAFVIAPPLQDYLQSQAMEGADPVVVQWDGGKLRQSGLAQLRTKHYRTLQYLQRLAAMTQQRGGRPKPTFNLRQAENDRQVIQILLLAAKAKQLGIRVSDAEVQDYLTRLTDEMVSGAEMRDVLLSDGVLNDKALFDQLEVELAAAKMRNLAAQGMLVTTPAALWDYYNRINRRVKAEILPVPVSQFFDQIEEQPSDEELTELFEKYKQQLPNPNTPEPGFRKPYEAAFHYIQADYDQFLERARKQVTAEEIEAEYKRRVDMGQFRTTAPPPRPRTGDRPPAPPPQPVGQGSLSRPASPSVSGALENAPSGPRGPVLYTAYQPPEPAAPAQEPASPAQDKGPAAASQDAAGQDAAGQDAAGQDAAGQDAAGQDAVTSPAATTQPVASSSGRDRPPAPPLESTTEPGGGAAPPVARVQSLEEVRQEIVDSLAASKAQTELTGTLEEITNEINKYRRVKDDDPPDVEALADKHQLQAGRLPMVDFFSVEQYDIGKVKRMMPYQTPQGQIDFYEETFAMRALDPALGLFRPQRLDSSDGTRYLYWKVKDSAEKEQTFEEARAQVERAWRLIKARKLADERANELKEKVTTGKSIKEALGEAAKDAFVTEPFSWLSRGMMPFGGGMPQMSDVPGVNRPGEEFMQVVHELGEGKVGVAFNRPRDEYYLIRINESTPGEDVRRSLFLRTGFMGDQFNLATVEGGQLLADWYQDLERDLRVTWKNTDTLQTELR